MLQSTPRAAAPPQPVRPRADPPRVCLLSEHLAGTPDEGVRKFTLELANALRRREPVAVLVTEGEAPFPGARLVPASRTFLSVRMRSELLRLQPEALIYVARSSTTLMAFVRSRVLKTYCPRARVVLVGLQARRHKRLSQHLIRYLAPDLVCVQSPESQRYLAALGCSVVLLPSGVDVQKFYPVTPERRRELRSQYGLDSATPVALHVGHLKTGRGVRVLAELAARRECQVVLVASSSTPQEAQLAQELHSAGVVVFSQYLAQIEQLYQLADCYVFPVQSTDNALEVPLSVLEALACDLPVVTTRFAGLPRLFADRPQPGLVFVDSPDELIAAAVRLARHGPGGTRPLALPYSWDAIAASLLDRALAKCTANTPNTLRPAHNGADPEGATGA